LRLSIKYKHRQYNSAAAAARHGTHEICLRNSCAHTRHIARGTTLRAGKARERAAEGKDPFWVDTGPNFRLVQRFGGDVRQDAHRVKQRRKVLRRGGPPRAEQDFSKGRVQCGRPPCARSTRAQLGRIRESISNSELLQFLRKARANKG
jgi:hypothetical protein